MTLLPPNFFLQKDVIKIAQSLLGCYLFTCIEGQISGGIIIETEAYKAENDKANHAYGGKKTKKNAMMFEEGGIAYIYLCYGMHCLLNFVTNAKNIPDAVLIRSIYPTHGLELMQKRTKKNRATPSITDGPGKLTKALGIDISQNGASLCSNTLWIEDRGLKTSPDKIIASPRIGIDYAGDDALLPYRFNLSPELYEK